MTDPRSAVHPHGAIEYSIPGIAVREFSLPVPLDWSAPDGEQIEVFVRELCDPAQIGRGLPLLAFLQGGPGGANPRPTERSGWIDEALENYRVVLVDQRGTGRSTRIEGVDVADMSNVEAADFLSHFRADSIVRDMEHVRTHAYGAQQWSTLGQSYGGFLTLTYLSTAPEGLTACYITGGVPGIANGADEVYRRTYDRVAAKTRAHYARFPHDEALAGAIADHLATHDVRLPDGSPLSVARFQSLGIDLGMKVGSQRLHWVLESAFSRPGRLSDAFLATCLELTGVAASPLYWVLQEAIYATAGQPPTDWSAERAAAERPMFNPSARPCAFTGEMQFRWMFDEVTALRPFKGAVEELARRTDWPALYDLERLAANTVPLIAAVWFDDMYVDAHLQLETLAQIGCSHAWVTNEHEHDGVKSGVVFNRLRAQLQDGEGRLG